MRFPWFLSMSVGFLSLSQEILWMRYIGFAERAVPQAFSLVLTLFLFGIAAGALVGRFFCARLQRLYYASAIVLTCACVLDMMGPIIAALPGMYALSWWLIFLCAAMKSIIFPIAHHLGSSSRSGQIGKSVSRVYFMNIMGSTLGPLVTGFWLVDHVTLQISMQCLALLTGLLSAACALREGDKRLIAILIPVILAFCTISFRQADMVSQHLACFEPKEGKHIRRIIETRSGIIHSALSRNGAGGNYNYGANLYDGRSNINPRDNASVLERVFVLGALRPEPANVLVVGMSGGAWVRILTEFPGVKHIQVVEINPGYLKLIADYPNISPFLKDPRVHVTIDDGRRWIKRHPAEHFDLIVMNTTFHQRVYSTNLLSREFLTLVKEHLNPGGIVAYNTTWLPDALKTAETIFPHAYLYVSSVIAGDHDFRPNIKNVHAQLMRYRLDGKPVFDANNKADRNFMDLVASTPFLTSKDQIKLLGREGEIITDWNMIPEYKYGVTSLPRTCSVD